MGQTISEKIFSKKSGMNVKAGDVIVAEIDSIMSNDASGPLSIDYFKKMNADSVAYPERITFILDHYVPCPNDKVASLQQSIFDFGKKYGIRVVPAGEGIAHQVFDELGYIKPGNLIVGGDSHTTTYGYLNCIGIGIGSSDLAMAVKTGKLWFKVPQTIKISLTGKPLQGISGKEIALHVLRLLGTNGANYKSIEFHGSGLKYLNIDDRKTICNLMAECGAKCSVMPYDEITENYCRTRGFDNLEGIFADSDCDYIGEHSIDLSTVNYIVAKPHKPSNCTSLSELSGLKIDMVLIGTCTNGRIEDFRKVDEIIKQSNNPFLVETLIVPASRTVYRQMINEGIADRLLDRNAVILPPGCGPCCGSSSGVPRDNFNVLSTANRNFIGRMGNTTANIYLTSPSVAAASAIKGYITNPGDVINND